MKRFMIESVFAAAALAAVAATAQAQQTLTAEIPFAFRAGQVQMAPGAYEIKADLSLAHKVFYLRNNDTRKAILLPLYVRQDPPKAWVKEGNPKLSFECVEKQCVLRQLWTGDSPAYKFLGPRPGADDAIRLAEIRLNRGSGN